MQYQQAIDFLYQQYPAFEKQGGLAYKPGLENVSGLSSEFNYPHTKFKSIHIAGTNGKGSSSNLIASVLQHAGYKTGLYTSPHIHDFNERIRINGLCIPHEQVINFVEQHNGVFQTYHPSFFEITTIMAFDWFARQQVDIAIIETGMGGRLDATNIIQPELCLITNVSLDHTQFLGDTVRKIALEKAGIIKAYTPVILSEYQIEIYDVFQNEASEKQAHLINTKSEYTYQNVRSNSDYIIVDIVKGPELLYKDLHCALTGSYQLSNMLGVIATLDQLIERGWKINKDHVFAGFKDVLHVTGFKGRWQVIRKNPLVICDAAHNVEGMRYSAEQLRALKKRMHIVLGMVKDKDVLKILELLPAEASYYFCEAHSQRAMPADQLHAMAHSIQLNGVAIKDVNEAVKAAMIEASEEDVIWVGGSLYVLGELEAL